MKAWAKKFYHSKAWQDCRDGYIQSVHGLCERCLSKEVIKPGKIVHHKELLTPQNINNPNIALNWNKLEYVCQDCHNREHMSKHSATREDVMFNENGDLILSVDSPL